MGDDRSPTRNLIEFSRIVATPDDIFFIPSDTAGQTFLNYRFLVVETHKYQWALLYQPGEPLSDENDLEFLESLNPADWKQQDHYAVLGLSHIRIRATDEDVRRTYRTRCLRHHPDKRMAAGQFVANPDGDYFACIVKAFEILGSSKRRSFDSVDPTFDDFIPQKIIKSPTHFFNIYGRWFFANAQWSNKVPVPLLGDIFTPRHEVEGFYNFWYSFDSWREYSYLDEEEKEKGADRDERRWIDKQNKAARAKLKKEEMARIRQVVDNAYASDPRILQYKLEDLEKKSAVKEAKRQVKRQKQLEEEHNRKAADAVVQAARELRDAQAKQLELQRKREQEILKKAYKRERKILRTSIHEYNYFANDHKVQMKNMSYVELLCESLSLLDLEELNRKMSGVSTTSAAQMFRKIVSRFTDTEPEVIDFAPTSILLEEIKTDNSGSVRDWSTDEQKLLEQGLKTYPITDPDRWSNIAMCVPTRSKKECLTRFKEIAAQVKAKKIIPLGVSKSER